MISRSVTFPSRRRSATAAICGAALFLLLTSTRHAPAQAAPAGTWPTGVTAPSEQPLSSQQLGTNLTLNQGVSAIAAENEQFHHFALGLEASGGGETNFFGTQEDQQTVAFAQFIGQVGLRLRTPRTEYFALYQPEYDVYPAFTGVNNYSQRFFQNLSHAITQRAGIAWGVTAARYLSLNQFLPQSLAIGGIGVVIPGNGSLLREDSFEITNVATTIQYRYLMSAKLTFSGALTTGLFLELPADVSPEFGGFSQRLVTSGADLRLDYQLTPRDSIGGELTPIYVYGIEPSGHLMAETLQATYQHQLTTTLQAELAAGPIFLQASNPGSSSTNDISYAVNAGLTRQVRQSQFSVAYRRAVLVDLLTSSQLSNGASFSAYLPLRRHWIFTGSANYTRNSGQGQVGSTTIYGGTAQLSYQVARNLQVFGRYSLESEDFNLQPPFGSFDFLRNQFGGGLRINLGSPVNLGGMQ